MFDTLPLEEDTKGQKGHHGKRTDTYLNQDTGSLNVRESQG